MFPLLRLVVLTPEETVLDVSGVRWVQAQLVDGGGIGIWPGHAPLLAGTVAAPLCYADKSGEHALPLDGGILRATPGRVTIYTARKLASASEQADTPAVPGSGAANVEQERA